MLKLAESVQLSTVVHISWNKAVPNKEVSFHMSSLDYTEINTIPFADILGFVSYWCISSVACFCV